jgi:hypothetical protein
MGPANRVSRNFVKNYGRARYRGLLCALEGRESGQVIGDQIGVSRERIRQYRDVLGTTSYSLFPAATEVFGDHHRYHWKEG